MFRFRRTGKQTLPRFRGALYNTDPGMTGGGGANGAPGTGTGTPGTPTPGTGTGDTPDFLTKKEFGQTAALIGGLKKTVETLSGSALTTERLNDALAAAGILVKDEEGKYKPAFAAPTKPDGSGTGNNTPPPPNPLENRVKALEKQLQDAQKAVEEERSKIREEKLNREVVEALRKAGAVNPERDFVHLKGLVSTDGDSYMIRTKDSTGLEQQYGIADYAATWLEQNPELKRAQGASGSGTKPGQSGGASVQFVSAQQAKDPDWWMKNREKIASGEIQIAKQ